MAPTPTLTTYGTTDKEQSDAERGQIPYFVMFLGHCLYFPPSYLIFDH